MKTALKLLIFATLMCIYWAFSGFHISSARSMGCLFITMDVVYFVGAIIAVFLGDKSFGTLDPISLRPIFIVWGLC